MQATVERTGLAPVGGFSQSARVITSSIPHDIGTKGPREEALSAAFSGIGMAFRPKENNGARAGERAGAGLSDRRSRQ